MKNLVAFLIVFAVRIIEARPKPKLIYSNVTYKCDSNYVYDHHHEDWNDYLRDTGL